MTASILYRTYWRTLNTEALPHMLSVKTKLTIMIK